MGVIGDMIDGFKQVIADDTSDLIKTARLNPVTRLISEATGIHAGNDFKSVGDAVRGVANTAVNTLSFVPFVAAPSAGIKIAKGATGIAKGTATVRAGKAMAKGEKILARSEGIHKYKVVQKPGPKVYTSGKPEGLQLVKTRPGIAVTPEWQKATAKSKELIRKGKSTRHYAWENQFKPGVKQMWKEQRGLTKIGAGAVAGQLVMDKRKRNNAWKMIKFGGGSI